MDRSVEHLLGEARDLFRRLNVQMLIVGGGLFLAYSVTFEEGYRSVGEQTRIRAGRLVLVERLRAGSETTRQLLRTQSSRVSERVAKQQLACAGENRANCPTATLATQAALRKQASLERKVKAYDRAIIENRRVVEQIRAKLRERVAFDLGSGLKLPFALAWAPIIWLVLLGLGLVAVARARALFWGFVAAAARKARQVGNSIETRSLAQLPFWLAPVGRPNRAVSVSELRRIVGWTASWRRKNAQLYLVLLLLFALLLRVAWIGSLFTFVADLPGTTGGTDAPAMPWLRLLTAALVVIDIGLLLWLSFPQRISERIPPPVVNRTERRRFIYAGGAGLLLWIGSGLATERAFRGQWAGLLDKSRKAFQRVPPKRSRAVDLSKTGLAPGWYFNTKSKAIHLLHPDGKIRRARGLEPAKLKKQSFPRLMMLQRVPTSSAHYRFLIDQDRALDFLATGSWKAALAVLGIGFSSQDAPGTVLRRIDLIGAIVHRFGDSVAARRLAEYFTQRMTGLADPELKTALSARLQRWTEPEFAEWRARKWSRQHPFRWAGRKIASKPSGA